MGHAGAARAGGWTESERPEGTSLEGFAGGAERHLVGVAPQCAVERRAEVISSRRAVVASDAG